jgi:hypothetical protein
MVIGALAWGAAERAEATAGTVRRRTIAGTLRRSRRTMPPTVRGTSGASPAALRAVFTRPRETLCVILG